MSIPNFDSSTGYLPAGDWEATWDEVVQRFGNGPRRKQILEGLRQVVEVLTAVGVETIWLDGSFVTSKHRPSDVDVVYKEPTDRPVMLPPLFYDRARLKDAVKVDLWKYPSIGVHLPGGLPQNIKNFFESDREDTPKGHVRLLIQEVTTP